MAKTYMDLKDENVEIIKHYRKSLLSYNEEIWVKRNQIRNFDLSIRSFCGVETYDLINIYLLIDMAEIINKKNIELFRDDRIKDKRTW